MVNLPKKLKGNLKTVFGKTEERKTERALIGEYEALVEEVLVKLTPNNLDTAAALLSIPEQIRGFGHVKEAHLVKARAQWASLLAEFRGEKVKTAVILELKRA
jgi:indolepyruvate ferredoxin oxidoreductase